MRYTYTNIKNTNYREGNRNYREEINTVRETKNTKQKTSLNTRGNSRV